MSTTVVSTETTIAAETTTLGLITTTETTTLGLNTTAGITTSGLNTTTGITTLGVNSTVGITTTILTTTTNGGLAATTGPDIWQLYFLDEFLPGTGIPLWVNWFWIGILLIAVVTLTVCLCCKANTIIEAEQIKKEPKPKPIAVAPVKVPEIVVNIDLNELNPYPQNTANEPKAATNKQELVMENNKVLVTKNNSKWKNTTAKVVNINKVISDKGWFVGNLMPASKSEKNKFKVESKQRVEYHNPPTPKAVQLDQSPNDWEAVYGHWNESRAPKRYSSQRRPSLVRIE
ncbi:unnamed protein product [Owenia fusiformis]|uniref:Uncharacterized protein n=1 Tax=Owenia fusiformis TaxID=6347 RepID=A0A8S4NQC2_OWEFU|nr:unnamed protein product [Owenia fusiformis]